MSSFDKSVQFEELSGRENQYGVYVADRWQVNEKLTLNLGLRYEYYPLMTREDRGIELLDVDTFIVRLGGVGGNADRPRHQGQQDALRAALRRRVPLQRQHGVPRRLRQDLHPAAMVAADARTLPVDDRLQRCRAERLHPVRQCVQRHPRRAKSGHLDRQRSAPARRGHDDARSERCRARRHAVVERVHRAPPPARYRDEHRLRRHPHRRAVRRPET